MGECKYFRLRPTTRGSEFSNTPSQLHRIRVEYFTPLLPSPPPVQCCNPQQIINGQFAASAADCIVSRIPLPPEFPFYSSDVLWIRPISVSSSLPGTISMHFTRISKPPVVAFILTAADCVTFTLPLSLSLCSSLMILLLRMKTDRGGERWNTGGKEAGEVAEEKCDLYHSSVRSLAINLFTILNEYSFDTYPSRRVNSMK